LPSERGAVLRSSINAAGTMWLMERMIHPIIVPMRLVLASASPRRAELLRAAGFAFDTLPVDLDERVRPGETPADYVRRLAMDKAARALELAGGAASGRAAEATPLVVLGADTAVVIDGAILGKPKDDGEGASMLRLLRGRAHQVLTGVCLRWGGEQVSRVEATTVEFRPLSDEDIAWYVASGEGRDKAGGYAIQGLASRFIPAIHGSYSNVVGLPIAAVHELVAEIASRQQSGYSS
jgi:septum formation protein